MVVACVSLGIALGGTSVAAINALPRNSVGTAQIKNGAVTKKKISKKTLRALKGNRGPRGLTGATGATGAAGAQGIQGIQGPAGPFPDGDIPGSKTIRGNYALGSATSSGSGFAWDQISFGFQMASALTGSYLAAGAPPTTACPGSSTNPQAAPGNVCVYEGLSANVGTRIIFNPATGGAGSNRWGAGVSATPSAAAPWFSYGTWAATSPAGMAVAPVAPTSSKIVGLR